MLNAIKKDKLTWINVCEKEDNAVADKYMISAVPSNVLVDKEGKIIAKNLFGKELEQKLAQVLN